MPLTSALILSAVVGAAVLAVSSLPLHADAAAPGELLFEFGDIGHPGYYEWEFDHAPYGFDVGPNGEIVVYDHDYQRVKVFYANGTFGFVFDHGLQFPTHNIRVGPDGSIILAGNSGGGLVNNLNVYHPNGTLDFRFNTPRVVDFDVGPNGAIAVLEVSPTRVHVYHPNGTLDFQLESQGRQGLGAVNNPGCIAAGPNGVIALCDSVDHAVKIFHPNGTLADTLQFPSLSQVDIGPTGELFVKPLSRIYHPNGTLVAKLHRGDGVGIHVDRAGRFGPTGEVVVASNSLPSLPVFGVFNGIEPTDDLRPPPVAPPPVAPPPVAPPPVAPPVAALPPPAAPPLATSLTGAALAFEFGSLGAGAGQFMAASGIAFGPDGIIAVSDVGNHRVQVFYPNGTFAFALGMLGEGPGEFYRPEGLSFGPDGLLAVSDMGNSRVQVFRIQ